MRALVWQGGKRFVVEQVPAPVAEPGRIVVKVEASAICGSDFHLDDFGAKPPLIPGHEVAGIVHETGEGVRNVKAGDRVALDPVQKCGRCYACTHGIEHLCEQYRHLGDRAVPGGWAEFVAVDAANAHPIPAGVSAVSAALTEPAAVCYQSFERAGLRPGDRVLILGDGPFGFLHAQLARALGAGNIVVAGHYEARLDPIRKQTGAVTCNTKTGELGAVLEREIGPPGVDIVIEATGAGASPGLGLKALRPRGTLVIFSYIWKPEALDMGLIHMKELQVHGSCRSRAGYGPCLALMAAGKLRTDLLVGLTVKLEQADQALEKLTKHKADTFKVVFTP